ncbi:HEAT repeat domain-containing protein [Geopsychrobacter electrodiphilus]|uniref:HEAT repeat domain-containing protein n=1 Tax=Geopsychrobacter electrodiphilus TaxID=225196 RepID=UPI00035F8736|nr:HEAT repeat domain-containing protein [Geopsychrobacter electrodiphilus]
MADKAQLALLLESPDTEERIAAVRQIAQVTDDPMTLFSIGLGDGDWRVRKAAVAAFFQVERPETYLDELIGYLHNPENAGLRNASIDILTSLGPLAVSQLRAEIACEDIEVRKFIIDILGEIGDSSCADELTCSLTDTDINVRYATVETLGKLRVLGAVEPLLALMTDPDPGLKFTILQSLTQIGGSIPIEPLAIHLKDPLLRRVLFDCFAKVGGCDAIPYLVRGLCDPLRQVREAAVMALFELQSSGHCPLDEELIKVNAGQIAGELEHLFLDERHQLKKAALAIYAPFGRTRDLRPLLSCVADEHLRSQALKVFADLGPTSYNRLLKSLSGPEPQELISLIHIGGELGFEQGLSFALDGIHAEDPQLRHTSTRTIGQLGSAAELNHLLRLLDDEVSEIQDAAVAAIARIGRRQRSDILRSIVPFLDDHDASKRMRTVRILGSLDGEEVEAHLLKAFKDSSSRVRCEALQALMGCCSEPVISGVTLGLTDESPEVRRLAVSALGQYPQSRVLPALFLAVEDNDLWVRTAVMRTLGHFSGEDVRKLLLRGIGDSIGLVVIAALEAAIIVIPDESRGLLEHALGHVDEEVVKTAMNHLGRLGATDWIEPFGRGLLHHPHWDVRIHAARNLGDSELSLAAQWLEERLKVEEDELVRQALNAALSSRLCVLSREH